MIVGLVLALAATATMGAWLSNTAVTLACLGLFHAGLFAAQVANQSTVPAVDPAAPPRYNSAYMLVYFVGGTVAACAIVLAMIITAAVRTATRSLG